MTFSTLHQGIDATANTRASSHLGFLFKERPFSYLNVRTLISLRDLQQGFSRVPLDEYVQSKTRFKDLARFRFNSGNGLVTKAAHGPLFHPINSGAYGNQASRNYPEIPDIDIDPILPLAEIFVRLTNVPDGEEILVQRQRIISHGTEKARTVQEGSHQDGVEKLAAVCIDRVNVEGGLSFLYDARREPIFAHQLEPGDILFIDDPRVWHDATPIWRANPSGAAYRDIIILTWPACRQDGVDITLDKPC
jgi:hypothetical protein